MIRKKCTAKETLEFWNFGLENLPMSASPKKSIAAAAALILLGMLVLIAGEKSLIVLIPAAVLVWYTAVPRLRSGRN